MKEMKEIDMSSTIDGEAIIGIISAIKGEGFEDFEFKTVNGWDEIRCTKTISVSNGFLRGTFKWSKPT